MEGVLCMLLLFRGACRAGGGRFWYILWPSAGIANSRVKNQTFERHQINQLHGFAPDERKGRLFSLIHISSIHPPAVASAVASVVETLRPPSHVFKQAVRYASHTRRTSSCRRHSSAVQFSALVTASQRLDISRPRPAKDTLFELL
jgi:hypothetical protein